MKRHHYFFLVIFLLFCTLANSQEMKTDSVNKVNKKGQAVMLFRYYYYPNLQIYYDTQDAVYLCKENNVWTKKNQLPGNTKGYSMSNNIYVLIKEYNGDTPYEFIDQHKKDFPPNYKSRKQTNVIVRQKSN